MGQYCYLMEDIDESVLAAKVSESGLEGMTEYLRERSKKAYFVKKEEIDAVEGGLFAQAERFFVLVQTDNLWKQHLQAIKYLQQAVGLRGYTQKDPLIEYKL